MLFKRFETLGYTDPNFSSGIGLSLVKELVDMATWFYHGG